MFSLKGLQWKYYAKKYKFFFYLFMNRLGSWEMESSSCPSTSIKEIYRSGPCYVNLSVCLFLFFSCLPVAGLRGGTLLTIGSIATPIFPFYLLCQFLNSIWSIPVLVWTFMLTFWNSILSHISAVLFFLLSFCSTKIFALFLKKQNRNKLHSCSCSFIPFLLGWSVCNKGPVRRIIRCWFHVKQ